MREGRNTRPAEDPIADRLLDLAERTTAMVWDTLGDGPVDPGEATEALADLMLALIHRGLEVETVSALAGVVHNLLVASGEVPPESVVAMQLTLLEAMDARGISLDATTLAAGVQDIIIAVERRTPGWFRSMFRQLDDASPAMPVAPAMPAPRRRHYRRALVGRAPPAADDDHHHRRHRHPYRVESVERRAPLLTPPPSHRTDLVRRVVLSWTTTTDDMERTHAEATH